MADTEPHSREMQFWIRSVYMIALIVWFIIIIAFRLYLGHGFLVLWIPIVFFVLSYYSVGHFCSQLSDCMLQTPIVTICILITVQVLYWVLKSNCQNRSRLIAVILLSAVLSLLSLLDLWVKHKRVIIWNHIRHCLQTMSLVVIIYAVISFGLENIIVNMIT